MASNMSVSAKGQATGADPLVALVRNPHVQVTVDWGFAAGLFHARRDDYLIGRAVDAYVGLLRKGDAGTALAIWTALEQLRHHPQYERYFRSDPPVQVSPEDMVKNPAYKAIGSIGH